MHKHTHTDKDIHTHIMCSDNDLKERVIFNICSQVEAVPMEGEWKSGKMDEGKGLQRLAGLG